MLFWTCLNFPHAKANISVAYQPHTRAYTQSCSYLVIIITEFSCWKEKLKGSPFKVKKLGRIRRSNWLWPLRECVQNSKDVVETLPFNSSQSSDILCLHLKASLPSLELIITVCVVTALLAPLAVAGNAFILVAIWKNPSLRTPSYVLLAGLAVTDFCTGLLTQPFFILQQVTAKWTGNKIMNCIAGRIVGTVNFFFFLNSARDDSDSCRKMAA